MNNILKEVLVCENCGKSFTSGTGYGKAGRWCSRSCCAQYNAVHNSYHGSQKQKESIAKARAHIKNHFFSKERPGGFCKFCGTEYPNRTSLRSHEKMCKENPNRQISAFLLYNKKLREGEIEKPFKNGAHKAKVLGLPYHNPLKGRELSPETRKKISDGVKKWCEENPEKQTFSRLRHNEGWVSYPEKYFREVFKNNSLSCVYEFPVKRYSLDFAWPDKKLYLEIDGGQHQWDWIKAHDEERDRILKELGWILIDRVKWWEFNSLERGDREIFINNLLSKIRSYLY